MGMSNIGKNAGKNNFKSHQHKLYIERETFLVFKVNIHLLLSDNLILLLLAAVCLL